MSADYPNRNRLDDAVSRRLSRLAAMPVDTSRIERQFHTLLADDEAAPAPRPRFRTFRWASWSGLAAAMITLAAVFFFTIGSETPVVAAPAQFAAIHQQMTGGEMKLSATRNLDALEKMLRGDAMPQGADNLPPALAHACCLQKLNGRAVTGVLVELDGQQVTVMITSDPQKKFALPKGEQVEHSGRTFVVHKPQDLTMAMTRIGDHIVCAMGDTDPQKLVILLADLAS